MSEQSMHGDRPTDVEESAGEAFDARLREAFEPPAATAQRLARQALEDPVEKPVSHPTRGGLGLGLAVAGALSAVLALAVTLGVWRIPPSNNPLPEDPPVQDAATIVISNESGFVTVTTGGSQWIVLPGDRS